MDVCCMLGCVFGVPCKFCAYTKKNAFGPFTSPTCFASTWHSIRVCQSCSPWCVCVEVRVKSSSWLDQPPPLRSRHQVLFHVFIFFLRWRTCSLLAGADDFVPPRQRVIIERTTLMQCALCANHISNSLDLISMNCNGNFGTTNSGTAKFETNSSSFANAGQRITDILYSTSVCVCAIFCLVRLMIMWNDK